MNEYATANTLQSLYKVLSKKQKGQVIQEIISHPLFSKSKEWLRKYIAGSYQKMDETVEEIGIASLEKVGITVDTLDIPIVEMEEVLTPILVAPIIQIEAPIPPLNSENLVIASRINAVNENAFKQIIEEYSQSYSLSKVGVGWAKFGRLCRSLPFQKVNPFIKITELDSFSTYNKTVLEIAELTDIYLQNIHSHQEFSYMSAWELFSLKARFVYDVNPFLAIQTIIIHLKTPQKHEVG